MGSSQREAGRCMVEHGAYPARSSGVARFARRWKSRGLVIGIGCGVVRREMARDAGHRQSRKHVVCVALSASHSHMGPRQRELGSRIVVKGSSQPIGGRVAQRTIR